MNETFLRRRLPHWNLPGAIYFITTCLDGSIPSQGLLDIARLRRSLARQAQPAGLTEQDWTSQKWSQTFGRIDNWLDHAPAVQHLKDPACAAEVVKSLRHFDGERYDLSAWVVMPSHLHWVFWPRDEWVHSLGTSADHRSPRERIQHSITSYTANICNRLLGRSGRFWQWESYDHCIRDEGELERIAAYIHANPVRAGLVARAEDFEFSSAGEHLRKERGLP